jgi:pimeloyl-ACP methyl ester carboxylesterase
VREYPVFIPSGEERLGAIITVPDRDPRGLVLLMPGGGGAPRAHRYAMYTKVARGLADRGIASVRMDWRGVGDSTGRARFSFHALPVEDSVTVARFALDATGTTAFGMAGNCGGARTTLMALPTVPEARSAVLMMLKPLTGTRSQRPTVKRMKLAVKRIPRVGMLVKRAYWAIRWRKANPVLDRVRALPDHTDLLFLEASTVKMGKLPEFVQSLQSRNGHQRRLEMRQLPGGASRAFHSLERQDFVVESLVDWFDQIFPGKSGGANGNGNGNGNRSARGAASARSEQTRQA